MSEYTRVFGSHGTTWHESSKMAAARAAPAREADTRQPPWALLARRDCIDAYVLWLLDARDVELRSVSGKGRGPAKGYCHIPPQCVGSISETVSDYRFQDQQVSSRSSWKRRLPFSSTVKVQSKQIIAHNTETVVHLQADINDQRSRVRTSLSTTLNRRHTHTNISAVSNSYLHHLRIGLVVLDLRYHNDVCPSTSSD